ncbi:MAG TPA: glycoside hydrolase family 3 C-terminal domain-containing protein, partial [Hyphomonas sp.]|nr:glycoside hydrolase family 3 C-terminal domain-containing protein [Hyphomonas sp.]
EKPLPSQRAGAGDTSLLGSAAHRDVARRAVRQSLVLLKNNDGTLPLAAKQTVLVVGDGADSISKVSGGWTLSWQGGGYDNAHFPNGQSILSGIRDVVEAAGGRVIHDPAGTSKVKADVVIAVYGEDPYAEFQGDRDNVDFVPDGYDPSLLADYRASGAKVVSVFLSGRPLWTNPEINASDAFVAAWWPGSEGGGVADLLFRTKPEYDFTGRLSYSWPSSAVQTPLNRGDANYTPQFAYGYGLSYAAPQTVGVLTEESGLASEANGARGAVFVRGQAVAPWSMRFEGSDGPPARVDHGAQEDALALSANSAPATLSFETAGAGLDWSRESNGAMELSFFARSMTAETASVNVSMGCTLEGGCTRQVPVAVGAEWAEHRISLSCFADAGVDMSKLTSAVRFGLDGGRVAFAGIALAEDKDGQPNCGG